MNEPKEQGEENMWSFYFCYHFGLNWRSSNVLSYVYWTNFCYTLFDLLACVPYYSMHVLNKHEGLSKKKKIIVFQDSVITDETVNFEKYKQELLGGIFSNIEQ